MKIKFITLNIYNGNLLDNCTLFLKNESPDIFVLQEVYRGGTVDSVKNHRSFEIIKDSFKNYYSFFSAEYFERVNGTKIESGNAIFSRFPIIKRKSIFYSGKYGEMLGEAPQKFITTGRNLQFARVKINSEIINVFNTHGIWSYDGKDSLARLKMSNAIVEEIKDMKKIILAGDFNLSSNTMTIKNIEEYLINVFKNKLTSTFNLKIKKEGLKRGLYFWKDSDLRGFSSAVVDMIFVSSDIKVIGHYCPKVDVSDHYPLVAVLEI